MPLSPRELEVARLVAEDCSDKEIARILLLSIHTVRAYLDRIGKKLGADQRKAARRRTIARWIEALENDTVTNDTEAA